MRSSGWISTATAASSSPPHDLAISPQLEVVQVYGFDLDELWQ